MSQREQERIARAARAIGERYITSHLGNTSVTVRSLREHLQGLGEVQATETALSILNTVQETGMTPGGTAVHAVRVFPKTDVEDFVLVPADRLLTRSQAEDFYKRQIISGWFKTLDRIDAAYENTGRRVDKKVKGELRTRLMLQILLEARDYDINLNLHGIEVIFFGKPFLNAEGARIFNQREQVIDRSDIDRFSQNMIRFNFNGTVSRQKSLDSRLSVQQNLYTLLRFAQEHQIGLEADRTFEGLLSLIHPNSVIPNRPDQHTQILLGEMRVLRGARKGDPANKEIIAMHQKRITAFMELLRQDQLGNVTITWEDDPEKPGVQDKIRLQLNSNIAFLREEDMENPADWIELALRAYPAS